MLNKQRQGKVSKGKQKKDWCRPTKLNLFCYSDRKTHKCQSNIKRTYWNFTYIICHHEEKKRFNLKKENLKVKEQIDTDSQKKRFILKYAETTLTR